jgi:hypothetical protein
MKQKKCEYCGSIGTSFHIHHIDRDRRNNCKENLEILCQECHGSISGGYAYEINFEKDYMNKRSRNHYVNFDEKKIDNIPYSALSIRNF